MRTLKELFALLRQAGVQWYNDNVFEMGAALAYYSLFSVAPLLVVAIAIAGLIFGEQAAQGEVVAQLRNVVGPDTAQAIEQMILRTRGAGSTTWAVVGSGISIFLGASWVFGQLQQSLNTIWRVRPRPDAGWWASVRDRLTSFLMVLGTGILLLVSLLLSTFLAAMADLMPAGPVTHNVLAWRVINGVASFLIITLLFAMIFRKLPDVEISWRDVWVGAAFTALLFTAGKYLIGLYLGTSSVVSPYGAAGSLVLVLLWVYYSALIVLFGAEFTQVWANRYGTRLTPSENAEAMRPCDERNPQVPRQDRAPARSTPRG